MAPHPVCVPPGARVQDVIALMNERRVGSVLVTGPSGELVGIFTERDLIREVAVAVPGWRDYPVSEWMTPGPHSTSPEVDWDDAAAEMQRHRVRHLPVLDGGAVVGVVSTRLLMAKRDEYLRHRVAERTGALKKANDQLMARDAEVLFNMRAAGHIQARAMLPQSPPSWPELRWALHYAPLDHLGGDYYDFAAPAPDALGFLIADASGHSIPAAFVAVLTRGAFAGAAARLVSPGAVLGEVNRQLVAFDGERFVTAFYVVIERGTGKARYAAAGHPPPLLWRAADRAVVPLPGGGFLLGVVPGEVYAEREIDLRPGDRVVFFTDGVLEAQNEIGELYGAARLADSVARQNPEATAAEWLAGLLADLAGFRGGAKLTDDLTLAVAEVVAAPASGESA